jgi:pimeloyl-ACP methyl ester carboxylesterase
MRAIDERKKLYKANGLHYYRPWIFLVTDGVPNDSWREAAAKVKQGEAEKKFALFAVGVEGADFNVLKEVSAREPLKLAGYKFREMFVWLSQSQRRYQAAEVALAELRASGVGPEATVLSSRSVGGGVAVEMAKRGHGARLVLLAPFTSVVDMANLAFPFLPTRLLVRDRFDNAAKAPGIRVPVLILHGDQDEIIPVEMGQRLGKLFPHATLETIPGAHHNDLLERTWPALVDRVAAFARVSR